MLLKGIHGYRHLSEPVPYFIYISSYTFLHFHFIHLLSYISFLFFTLYHVLHISFFLLYHVPFVPCLLMNHFENCSCDKMRLLVGPPSLKCSALECTLRPVLITRNTMFENNRRTLYTCPAMFATFALYQSSVAIL